MTDTDLQNIADQMERLIALLAEGCTQASPLETMVGNELTPAQRREEAARQLAVTAKAWQRAHTELASA